MTGVYQCYCQNQGFASAFSSGPASICETYYLKFLDGGILMTKPFGITIGILNNILAALIKFGGKNIKFHSTHTRSKFEFITIFVVSYYNSGLFVTAVHKHNLEFNSKAFLEVYSSMILTTTLTTNLIPYIAVFIDLIVNKCCRRRARSELQFKVERKYAQILSSICVICTFGFGIPLLFVYTLVPLVFYLFLDKILLVYWYKPVPMQSDILTRTFMIIFKYVPILLLVLTSLTILNSYCIAHNFEYTKFYTMLFVLNKDVTPLCGILWAAAVAIFGFILIFEVVSRYYIKKQAKLAATQDKDFIA